MKSNRHTNFVKGLLVGTLVLGMACLALPALTGCATVEASQPGAEAVTVRSDLSKVAYSMSGGSKWIVKTPPALRFAGATATGQELRQWARDNGLRVAFAADPDARYAQLEAGSAVEACLWLKRFNWDTGYEYQLDGRDCDNFARRFRAFPDLFANPTGAQPAVFTIYATMAQPFAGVSDGRHALNVAWTDEGVFVFEPQGIDLTYQLLEAWPNRSGISHTLTD